MYLLYKRIKKSYSNKGAVRLPDEPEAERATENKSQSTFEANQHIYLVETVSRYHHGPFWISWITWDSNSKTKRYRYTIKNQARPNSEEISNPDTLGRFWVLADNIRTVAEVEEEERNGGGVVKIVEESNEKMVRDWLELEGDTGIRGKKVKAAKKELMIMDKLNGAGIYP